MHNQFGTDPVSRGPASSSIKQPDQALQVACLRSHMQWSTPHLQQTLVNTHEMCPTTSNLNIMLMVVQQLKLAPMPKLLLQGACWQA